MDRLAARFLIMMPLVPRAPFQTQADESKGDWERESSEYKKKKDAAKANAPPGFPLG